MKIALAQTNPTVGDIKANCATISRFIDQAAGAGARLVVFPELSLIGYPPKDLLLKPQFIDDNVAALEGLARTVQGCAALVGFVCRHEGATGRSLHNAAALLDEGRVVAVYYKQLLPSYDVFDETRYFEPAGSCQVIDFAGLRIGLTICEDIWQGPESAARPLYRAQPFAELAEAGAELVINMSASPFVVNKHSFRCDIFARQCREHHLPLIYVNQVGGNDELVFDGCSCAFDADGRAIVQAKDFAEDMLPVDLDLICQSGKGRAGTDRNGIDRDNIDKTGAGGNGIDRNSADENNTGVSGPGNYAGARRESLRNGIASVHAALVLGLRDYVRKCGFKSVVLGLSGGIDSAVTAALAVESLGVDNVLGVALPSRYSSSHSLDDAAELVRNFGVKLLTIPIECVHTAMEATLEPYFRDLPGGIAEENVQARLRGNILMGLSNKLGHLLLTTGNKSELAVGYCTIYGDMAGGLAVISDVPKTMVYELARYINRNGELIPETSITKAPSAELRPNQTDQDTLAPYEQLDDILQRYVEQEQSLTDIVAAGFDGELVEKTISLVDRNEYKRRQAAPGLKVTSRAFGFGRRMPIAQNYQPCRK